MAATFNPDEHIYDDTSDAHYVKLNLSVRKGEETVNTKWKKAALVLGSVCILLSTTVIALVWWMLSIKGKGAVTSI